ncbi:MAG: glycosyltransferase [Promethearchaeota archaeon]
MNVIWVTCFEYQGIAKVGGLGEVSVHQTSSLSKDFDFCVFLPSHGQIERLKTHYQVQQLPLHCKGKQKFSFIKNKKKRREFQIDFYKVKMEDINVILLSGGNSFTRGFLDNKIVYNPDSLQGKICFFSIGMKFYINKLLEKKNYNALPKIIHLHDYHVVLPFISIKQALMKKGFDTSSLITFHLLTWPRFELDFYKDCGIDDTPFRILTREGNKNLTISEIFNLILETWKEQQARKSLNTHEIPTVEQVGAVVSDLVITVSESYLKSDIIPNLGNELIKFKTDFVWNGCDWNHDIMLENILKELGNEIQEVLRLPSRHSISREDLKRYLLTFKLGNLTESPLIQSKKILAVINEISNGNSFIKNGNIKNFSDSGPLAISTGRISRQKGFDIIFDAIPLVLEKIPDAKFLILALPTEYSLEEIKHYAEQVKKYPYNLRILFGLAPDIFKLAHLSADIYTAVSRWEPFGIIALEAMASKLPVIASKVGGLQETIIDIREDIEKGTGILIPKEKPINLAEALITFFQLARINELSKGGISLEKIQKEINVNEIPISLLKSQVIKNPQFYEKIRENCYRRVQEHFRWTVVSKKLKLLYDGLLQ